MSREQEPKPQQAEDGLMDGTCLPKPVAAETGLRGRARGDAIAISRNVVAKKQKLLQPGC